MNGVPATAEALREAGRVEENRPMETKPGERLQALVPATSTPSTSEIKTLTALAATLSKSGLATAKKSPEQTLAIALLGRELGVPIMASLQGIFISAQGQPSFSANLTASLLARGGVTWGVVENTAKRASVLFHRKGWQDIESSFTWDEAKLAGLIGKDVWRKYPADLLWARAFTRGARKIGPDLLAGFGGYTADELGDESHDPEFAPGRSASSSATIPAATPRNVESTVASPPAGRPNTSTPADKPSPKPDAEAAEEIPPHLLERIDNMLAMNSQLNDDTKMMITTTICVNLLRKYRKDGDTWEAVEIKLEAGLDKISEALRQQVEGAMNAE